MTTATAPAATADPITLAVVPRGDDVLRLELVEFEHVPLLSLRVWFCAKDGEWRPGRQGVTIRVGELNDVLDGLELARVSLS
jgi:hypothetical protein